MFNRKRIRAFTLQEMVVVLLLSAILTGFAYYAFMAVQQYYQKYTYKSSFVEQVKRLDFLLNQDTRKSKVVRKTESGFVCVYKNHEVDYVFEEEVILRKQNMVVDTFYCTNLELTCLMKKNTPVLNGHLLDELSLTMNISNEPLHFRLKKKYAADILMQYQLEFLDYKSL